MAKSVNVSGRMSVGRFEGDFINEEVPAHQYSDVEVFDND